MYGVFLPKGLAYYCAILFVFFPREVYIGVFSEYHVNWYRPKQKQKAKKRYRQWVVNPFRTAVPFWGQTTRISSSLSPKRECSPKRLLKASRGVRPPRDKPVEIVSPLSIVRSAFETKKKCHPATRTSTALLIAYTGVRRFSQLVLVCTR